MCIEWAYIDKMVDQVDASDVSWAIYNLCWKMDSFVWIQTLDTLSTDTKGKYMYVSMINLMSNGMHFYISVSMVAFDVACVMTSNIDMVMYNSVTHKDHLVAIYKYIQPCCTMFHNALNTIQQDTDITFQHIADGPIFTACPA